MFDVPVVLFIFKRTKAVEIIKRISEVKPQRLYIIADYGRNDEEKKLADQCRELVESAIDWDCELIKNYAEENRGVYKNIALGAMWVFEREARAIFLEDDNLPEVTFFRFCQEMLDRYNDDQRILWICGTNYLGKYDSPYNHSYCFTSHMLPCGWASWADKFCRCYDGDLKLMDDPFVMNNIQYEYCNKDVYEQYIGYSKAEKRRIQSNAKPLSWDYQMDFSIKSNHLLGICPCNNQIKNIGVDEFSTHGGYDLSMVMTQRFCGMESYPMEFPLVHPDSVLRDMEFEKQIGKIILYPLGHRIKNKLQAVARKILHIPESKSVRQHIKEKLLKK